MYWRRSGARVQSPQAISSPQTGPLVVNSKKCHLKSSATFQKLRPSPREPVYERFRACADFMVAGAGANERELPGSGCRMALFAMPSYTGTKLPELVVKSSRSSNCLGNRLWPALVQKNLSSASTTKD